MCNRIHLNHSQPIPIKGKCWKLFQKDANGKLTTWMRGTPYNIKDKGGWIRWDEYCGGHGFCGFLSKESAKWVLEACRTTSQKDVLVEVEYEGGLCRQWETAIIMDKTIETCLFKSFRPIEEV